MKGILIIMVVAIVALVISYIYEVKRFPGDNW